MKKLLLVALSLLVSCTNLDSWSSKLSKMNEKEREKSIINMYEKLNLKYYKLLEDELKKKDLENLETKFINLKKEILNIDKKVISSEHNTFLNDYIKNINLKIQYLKDLK